MDFQFERFHAVAEDGIATDCADDAIGNRDGRVRKQTHLPIQCRDQSVGDPDVHAVTSRRNRKRFLQPPEQPDHRQRCAIAPYPRSELFQPCSSIISFSDPYYDAGIGAAKPAGSPITNPEDLNGKVVGVQIGTSGQIFVRGELAGD